MAYSDWGGYVWENGVLQKDRSDAFISETGESFMKFRYLGEQVQSEVSSTICENSLNGLAEIKIGDTVYVTKRCENTFCDPTQYGTNIFLSDIPLKVEGIIKISTNGGINTIESFIAKLSCDISRKMRIEYLNVDWLSVDKNYIGTDS